MVREIRAPRLLAGRFSRAERIRQRAKIHLDDAALSDKTQVRYYHALRKVLPYVEKATSDDHLDICLCSWIRRMWRTGEPLLTIGDGLSALAFFQPSTRRKVPHAWKLFSVWRKIEIPSRAPPLTWALVVSMAAFEWQHDHFEMAVILLLSFHCSLRTGELLAVKAEDFHLGRKSGVLSLYNTKSGVRFNANEAVSITNSLVLEMIRILIDVRRANNLSALPIWSRSPAQFRQRFKELCNIMKIDHHEIRPYSLRRGGATDYFQRTRSMEATLVRGRWESSRVARLYISDALSFLPSIKLSAHTQSFMAAYNFDSYTK